MKKLLSLLCSVIFSLSACNKLGSSKITQLIDFTPALEVDPLAKNSKIVIDSAVPVSKWPNHINSVNEQPSNIRLSSNLERFITTKVGSDRISTPPIIAGSNIYILDNKDIVTSYDINSLKKLWSVNISPSGFKKEFPGGGLVYKDGKIAVVGGSRDVVVLNAQDGSEVFRKTLSDITKTQPILDGDKLIVLTVSNALYAININTGATLWQHEALPEVIVGGRYIAPIIYKDKIIITYSSGSIYVINAKNGEQEWGLNLAAESSEMAGFAAMNVEVQPIIENGYLYVASNSGNLYKFAIANGETIWKKPIQDIKALSHSGNMLYIVTNAKQIAAVSKERGLVKWALSLRTDKDMKNAKPVAFSNPLMINNVIHFTTSDGNLFKVNPQTGSLIEKITIVNGALSQAVANDNYFIFTQIPHIVRSAN
jgi:outer membrane protein assembly factor BamB